MFEGKGQEVLHDPAFVPGEPWDPADILKIFPEHFIVQAFAPEEVFDGYPDTFKEMMASVQFQGLKNQPFVEPIGPERGETSPGVQAERLQSEREIRKQRAQEYRERARSLEAQLKTVQPFLENTKRQLEETKDPERREKIKSLQRTGKQQFGSMYMRLADLYFRMGELDKAIEKIREAMSLDPDNSKKYREHLEEFEEARKVSR